MRSRIVKYSLIAVSATLVVAGVVFQTSALTQSIRLRSKADTDLQLKKIQKKGDAIYWNEVAEQYLHEGPISKAFECYEKGIASDATESAIFQNLGTALFLYRKDAAKYYDLDEQQVYDRVFEIYDKALKLEPDNFALATDIAMTYYGIRPQRPEQALKAWRHALSLATTDVEREGIYVHLARTEINAGLLGGAHNSLAAVKDPVYAEMKETLIRRLREAQGL